jgi:hypothetical protein
MSPRRPNRQDDATPRLLLAFLTGTLAMVLAIAELWRGGGDWVDFVAIALLLALAALVLTMLLHELDEQEQPAEDGADERATTGDGARTHDPRIGHRDPGAEP